MPYGRRRRESNPRLQQPVRRLTLYQINVVPSAFVTLELLPENVAQVFQPASVLVNKPFVEPKDFFSRLEQVRKPALRFFFWVGDKNGERASRLPEMKGRIPFARRLLARCNVLPPAFANANFKEL